MKKFFLCAMALQFAFVPAIAQSGRNVALSMDQQSKISEIITRQTPQPLTNINFAVAKDVVIPSNVSLQRLPAEAEQLAPQLKGDSYLVSRGRRTGGHRRYQLPQDHQRDAADAAAGKRQMSR
jgi:hypothetical protein